MELIRKLSRSGHRSRVVVIPKIWLDSVKSKTGKDVEWLKVNVDGKIVIEPYYPEE